MSSLFTLMMAIILEVAGIIAMKWYHFYTFRKGAGS